MESSWRINFYNEPEEKIETMVVRFRTIGDATCTERYLVTTLDHIISEVASARQMNAGHEQMINDRKLLWKDRKRDYFNGVQYYPWCK